MLFFALIAPGVKVRASEIEWDSAMKGSKAAAQAYASADRYNAAEKRGTDRTVHSLTGSKAAAIPPITIMTVSLAGAAYLIYRKKRF